MNTTTSLFYCLLGALLIGWSTRLTPPPNLLSHPTASSRADTFPSGMSEAEYARLLAPAQQKEWRDSGYYFQLERVDFLAQNVFTTAGGNYLINASFTSSDASSLSFNGQAQFRLRTADLPNNLPPMLLDSLIGGRAIIAFPQDILLCPTQEQENGMGQQDPYFPLYTMGRVSSIYMDSLPFLFQPPIPTSVQIQDFEVTQ